MGVTTGMARGTVRVLLADECPATLRGLENLLSSVRSAEVVGGATSRKEALGLAEELRPGVVFLDPSFHARAPVPLRNSEVPEVDVRWALRSVAGPLRIVAYSAFNTTADLMALNLAGIDGYVHKSTPLEHVARFLANVLAGRRPPWHLGLELEEAQSRLVAAARVYRLTPAEKAVLALVLEGCGDKQMADLLMISPHTVKKHVGSMLRKLDYRNRKELFRA